MDRYKFRGKRLDNGEWVEGYYLKYDETESEQCAEDFFDITKDITKDYIQVYSHFDCSHDHLHEVDGSTVGQYTGLRDNNGVDIYEGDVVKTVALLNDHNQRGATSKVIVRYYNGGYCLCFEGYESGTAIQSSFLVSHEIEIIGNIHDNKELLQQ
ncbi:MAG TPA: YopX family protein [Candidatus Paenibacillus intestinavium]|nr:YopX family protein [Candidatus Paenibacillus intestinavium]